MDQPVDIQKMLSSSTSIKRDVTQVVSSLEFGYKPNKYMTLKRYRLDVITTSRSHNNVQMTSF